MGERASGRASRSLAKPAWMPLKAMGVVSRESKESDEQLIAELDDLLARLDTIDDAGAALTPADQIGEVDAVILAVAHKEFRDGGWPMISKLLGGPGVVLDVRGVLDRATTPAGVTLWRM